jgi:hypothetical protein
MFVLVSTKTNICSEAAVSESFVGYSVLAVNILLGEAEQEKKTQRASPFGSPENGDFAKTLNVAYPPKTGARGESQRCTFSQKNLSMLSGMAVCPPKTGARGESQRCTFSQKSLSMLSCMSVCPPKTGARGESQRCTFSQKSLSMLSGMAVCPPKPGVRG